MAILKQLLVHGSSRFLNTIYANDLNVDGTTAFTDLTVTGTTNLAAGSANSASLQINSKGALYGYDAWLRINEQKQFTSGVYFGTNVVRTDGSFQVGNGGANILMNTSAATFKVPINMNGTTYKWDTSGNIVVKKITASSGLVDDLIVTNELRTFKWDIQHIANLGGSFLVTPTLNCTANSATFTVTAISGNTITAAIKDSTAITGNSLGGTTWPADSKIKISGKIGGIVLGTCDGKLTAAMNNTAGTLNIQFTYPDQATNPLAVQTYNAANVSNLTVMLTTVGATNPIGIYMTSYDTNGFSHISLYGGTATAPTVRIGNLQGLAAINNVTPTGWGIYTNNGFFSGTVVSESGKIGGYTLDSTSLFSGTKGNSTTSGHFTLTTGTFSRAIDGTTRSNLQIALGAKFGVANDGTLYTNGANITNINASNIKTGTLSADRIAANSIQASKLSISDLQAIGATIGGFDVDSTSIHTNDVAVTSNADNSIALSSSDFTRTINGTSRAGLRFAIGDKFGVTGDGAIYASSATISGAITATSGTIGGWTANSSYGLYTNGKTSATSTQTGILIQKDGAIYAGAYDSTKTACPFQVTSAGALTATSATITGSITATSGTIGGCTIDTDGNLQVPAANITGKLTANQINVSDLKALNATIGGFTIGNTAIYNGKTSYSQTTNDGVWLGTDGIGLGKGAFYVTNAGSVYAKSGTIGGWTLSANSLTTGTWGNNNSAMLCTGTSTAKSIGGSASISGWVLTAGANFGVTKTGAIYANDVHLSGEITATSGTIGGWTANSSYGLYTNNKTTATSTTTGILLKNDGAIYAGAYNSTNQACPFQVTSAGAITATSGTIGGWTIGTSAIYKTTNSMTSTGVGLYLGTDGIRNYKDADTYVNIQNGKITAKAVDLTGSITATSGTIGGCTINANGVLQVPAANITGQLTASQIDASGITIGQSQVTNLSTALGNKADATTVTALSNKVTAVYGTSSTEAATQIKDITCANFTLFTGARITIKFTKANTAASPKIKFNGQDDADACAIWVYNTGATTINPILWTANAVLTFTYNGSVWVLENKPSTYNVNSSAAATAQNKTTGTPSGVLILDGTIVIVNFSQSNTYISNYLQLNFAGTGNAKIYLDSGVTSATNTLLWNANTTLTFTRDGATWRLTSRSDASETATNYITYVNATDGIKVHNASDTANYTQINSDGMFVYKSSTKVASFGERVMLGKDGDNQLSLDGSGLFAKTPNGEAVFIVQPGVPESTSVSVTEDTGYIRYENNNSFTYTLTNTPSDGKVDVYGHIYFDEDENTMSGTGVFNFTSNGTITWQGTAGSSINYNGSITKSDNVFTISITCSSQAHHAVFYFSYKTTTSSRSAAYITFGSRLSEFQIGDFSTVFGRYCYASGRDSFASGYFSQAHGDYSHCEGRASRSYGMISHAEGSSTVANGYASHAEGNASNASGYYSHAEGYASNASGAYSHAQNLFTKASSESQTAIGKYNIEDTNDTYAFIIGNGTPSVSKNAFTVDWNGNGVLEGKLTVGTAPTANMDVATKKYVDDNAVSPSAFYYSVNDTFSVVYMPLNGSVASTNAKFFVDVVVDRDLTNISNVSVINMTGTLRGVKGVIDSNGISAVNLANSSTYTIDTNIKGTRHVVINVTKSSAFSNSTANTPVSFHADTLTLKFT